MKYLILFLLLLAGCETTDSNYKFTPQPPAQNPVFIPIPHK